MFIYLSLNKEQHDAKPPYVATLESLMAIPYKTVIFVDCPIETVSLNCSMF